ncbi:MAG: hypothetical protein RIQ70_1168 [Bacteroidota bacterium]|jgi:putative phosphoribosyl transferase
MFKDRIDAAIQLAKKLEKYKNTPGIILAIPRGGVPIGAIIAKTLGMPLEIILSKKIGHPKNPEYAIGSATMQEVIINENVPDVPKDYIQIEAARVQQNLKQKYADLMGDTKPTNVKDKTVILIDDGIATGSTVLASIALIKKSKPAKIIVAIPVATEEAIKKIKNVVDEVYCVLIPAIFYGVGQFYTDFEQVSDEEVKALLFQSSTIEKA